MDTITTAKVLPAPCIDGRSVRVTLTFLGFRNDYGHILVSRGAEVTYAVTDGVASHVVTGSDLRAPSGFNTTVGDLVRALCSFLANEAELAEWHQGDERCDDCYHAERPCIVSPERAAAIEAMREAIDAGSWIGQPS